MIHNVTLILLDPGLNVFIVYKEDDVEKKTRWRQLPGDVPVNITGDLSEFELAVETMSKFFIQIIDPTFHDHQLQRKIDSTLAKEASRAELLRTKGYDIKLVMERRRTAELKSEGYKT